MITVLDSTLREGEQTPGVCFHPHTKLSIARHLDRVGVQIIEAGHPAVGPHVRHAVARLARAGLRARIAAHARTCRSDVDVALDCGVHMLGVFYCVSDGRLNGVFRNDLNRAVDLIADTIGYARARRPDLLIRYTPEDTVRSSFDNVVQAASAAVAAGADIISVADTTGYMIPGTERSMFDYVLRLKTALGERGARPRFAVHCHNDRGLALANAIDGVRAGATIVDASTLGLGERAGITDLAQLLTVLAHDLSIAGSWNLAALPALYRCVSRRAGVPIPVNAPLVGRNAFTHCAGVHTHAAARDPAHYQSVEPGWMGRAMLVALDHMSGGSSVRYRLRELGIAAPTDELVARVLEQVRCVGETGRTVERAELREIVDWYEEHGHDQGGLSAFHPAQGRAAPAR